MNKFIFAVLILMFSNTAFSEDLSGKWNATMAGPQGAMYMVFNFMADGSELAGSMTSDMMGTAEISDGMVNGDEFSFNVAMQGGPGGAMTIGFKGAIDGDALSMNMEMVGMPGAPAGGMPIAALRAQ